MWKIRHFYLDGSLLFTPGYSGNPHLKLLLDVLHRSTFSEILHLLEKPLAVDGAGQGIPERNGGFNEKMMQKS
jgi:hypothetical protein